MEENTKIDCRCKGNNPSCFLCDGTGLYNPNEEELLIPKNINSPKATQKIKNITKKTYNFESRIRKTEKVEVSFYGKSVRIKDILDVYNISIPELKRHFEELFGRKIERKVTINSTISFRTFKELRDNKFKNLKIEKNIYQDNSGTKTSNNKIALLETLKQKLGIKTFNKSGEEKSREDFSLTKKNTVPTFNDLKVIQELKKKFSSQG